MTPVSLEQPVQPRQLPPKAFGFLGGKSNNRLACRHILGHARLCRDSGPRSNVQMTANSGLPADHDKVFQSSGAGHADLPCNQAIPANFDVMRDMYEIINLRPRPNHRIRTGTAIDGRICANLHAIADEHPAELRNLLVSAGSGRIAEPVLTDPDPGVDAHRLSN